MSRNKCNMITICGEPVKYLEQYQVFYWILRAVLWRSYYCNKWQRRPRGSGLDSCSKLSDWHRTSVTSRILTSRGATFQCCRGFQQHLLSARQDELTLVDVTFWSIALPWIGEVCPFLLVFQSIHQNSLQFSSKVKSHSRGCSRGLYYILDPPKATGGHC